MRRRIAFFVLVLGLSLLACQVILGIEPVATEERPDAPDVFEAAPLPDAFIPDPCAHVQPPALPPVDDGANLDIGDAASGNNRGELFFALRKVNLAPAPGTQIGYDLDGVCACDTRAGAAHDGRQSCKEAPGVMAPCDDDGGIDNALFKAFSRFSGLANVDDSANVNNRISKGQQNALLVITKYNGLANDRSIGVGIFTSEGILDDHRDGGLGLQPGCPAASSLVDPFWTPGWCGKDRWSASFDSVTFSGDKFLPKVSGTGYVSNYVFVTKFEGAAVVPFLGYQLSLGSPLATGRLVPLDENQKPLEKPDAGPVPFWRIEDGVLSGRIATSEILAAVGTAGVPGGGGHACSSPAFKALLKPAICTGVDMNLTSTLDFQNGATCNALSTALTYRADPIVIDRIVPTPMATNECYPTDDGDGGLRPKGVDGGTYTCP